MAFVDLFAASLTVLGFPLSGAKVLDCCAGDGKLLYSLVNHFTQVASNDLDSKARTNTHFDIRRAEFWTHYQGQYDYLITKPPSSLVETIVLQFSDQFTLTALFLSAEKISQVQSIISAKPPAVILSIASQNYWYIWSNSLSYRNILIDFTEQDVELRSRTTFEDFAAHIKDRIHISISQKHQPSHQFMPPSHIYNPTTFQAQTHPYPNGTFPDPSTDPYQNGSASQFPIKRDPTNGLSPYWDPSKRLDGAPAFSDFGQLGHLNPNAAAYTARHPNGAGYGQSMLPYYGRAPHPGSSQWQFQQPWTGQPAFSAAHMASTLGAPPPHMLVNNGYSHNMAHPSGTGFNPAAILVDMEKLPTGPLSPPRSSTDITASSSNSAAYSLHKPTAFKAGNNGSPAPSAAAVAAAIDDSNLNMLSPAEMLYLKGVHAAKQGKALEVAIDKYRSMYSKKDVITKVCKMKYRSAQRKLRIAKHIQRFPEIATMTQRQAERYISERLKKTRSTDSASRSPSPSIEQDGAPIEEKSPM